MINRYLITVLLSAIFTTISAAECPAFLNQSLNKLHSSKTLNVCEAYPGKMLLIVNTASFCGFTPQFTQLEKLHQQYKDKGLVVLGFPSNDFKQEAKSAEETATVCYKNYGVTFDMFAPMVVTGAAANRIFKALTEQSSAPAWNFNKYLVDPSGKVLRYFDSQVTPDSVAMKQAIERALKIQPE